MINFTPDRWRSIMAFMALWNLYFEVYPVLGNTEVNKHLEQGTKLLAAGQLADALAQYSLAVDLDPKNYLTYFRRATVFMGMGKTKSAIPDLDMSLQLKPDFDAARMQRANLNLKQGNIALSKQDYRHVLDHNPGHHESESQLILLGQTADHVESAKSYFENRMFQEAIQSLDPAIEVMPMSEELRELRANSYLNLGDKQKAIQDFRFSVKLTNDNTAGLLKLSKLMYEAGEAELSLNEIRECLRLDPDHKACFKHYKMIKKLNKLIDSTQTASNENQFEDCIRKAEKILSTERHIDNFRHTAMRHICRCKTKMGSSEAVAACTEALNADPENEELLCDRGDAHISAELYNEAIYDFQKVLERERRHQRANEGVKKAQKLLKNAKRRDYYKILGVPRHSTKKEILKAYRKLAAEYHPDSYKGTEKKKAEKMFIDITDSKEVLTDKEKRAQFDNGEDPLDPEQQHHGQSGNPFGGFSFHNFDPFGGQGGGGGNYEFHFG